MPEISVRGLEMPQSPIRKLAPLANAAKERGIKELIANIYSFNQQSRKMFESIGFKQIDEELYMYKL